MLGSEKKFGKYRVLAVHFEYPSRFIYNTMYINKLSIYTIRTFRIPSVVKLFIRSLYLIYNHLLSNLKPPASRAVLYLPCSPCP